MRPLNDGTASHADVYPFFPPPDSSSFCVFSSESLCHCSADGIRGYLALSFSPSSIYNSRFYVSRLAECTVLCYLITAFPAFVEDIRRVDPPLFYSISFLRTFSQSQRPIPVIPRLPFRPPLSLVFSPFPSDKIFFFRLFEIDFRRCDVL